MVRAIPQLCPGEIGSGKAPIRTIPLGTSHLRSHNMAGLADLFAGSSASENFLRLFAGKPIPVSVVWEPVLMTDWARPPTLTLKGISDSPLRSWERPRSLLGAPVKVGGKRRQRNVQPRDLNWLPRLRRRIPPDPQQFSSDGPLPRDQAYLEEP